MLPLLLLPSFSHFMVDFWGTLQNNREREKGESAGEPSEGELSRDEDEDEGERERESERKTGRKQAQPWVYFGILLAPSSLTLSSWLRTEASEKAERSPREGERSERRGSHSHTWERREEEENGMEGKEKRKKSGWRATE